MPEWLWRELCCKALLCASCARHVCIMCTSCAREVYMISVMQLRVMATPTTTCFLRIGQWPGPSCPGSTEMFLLHKQTHLWCDTTTQNIYYNSLFLQHLSQYMQCTEFKSFQLSWFALLHVHALLHTFKQPPVPYTFNGGKRIERALKFLKNK